MQNVQVTEWVLYGLFGLIGIYVGQTKLFVYFFCYFDSSGNCFVENLKLILRAPPRFESMNGKQIEVPEFQVTTIDVNFYTGIMKYRLDSLLMDMVMMKFYNKTMK